ncbi:tRNA (guanine-N(7)-)-methyltransferase-like isoform X2 [Macadamia integrifolia]|uniref:tRNA (guanine-N(7)-)-methyltransferase-like isoform X2 n=1 Tax=Macadamia integrifolia TaxID=60698 RepID=UPI001C4F4072|nr:tRNA (guanine-N(7)-)-methyltransferase-like isoform X2 [Macadamia integrifolia]
MNSLHVHAAAAVVPRATRALCSSSTLLFFNHTPNFLSTLNHFNIGLPNNIRHHNCSCFYRFNRSVAAELRSPDLVALEYAELNLKEKVSEVGHVRIRQHVNPLSASLTIPVEVPNWNEVYGDSMLPLMVDIGSGSGRFLIWLARRFPESKNYLGLEIRDKLVKRAQFWVKELALNNVYFMFANALVSFEQLVSSYPGPLMLVSILQWTYLGMILVHPLAVS